MQESGKNINFADDTLRHENTNTMKHTLYYIVALLIALIPIKAHAQQTEDLVKGFLCPPREARPYVWWHWMDGNVSKEGIRKDLLWMKSQGIGGLHQFDAGGVNMPRAAKVRLPYMSTGWKDAFRYALRLADSLGLEVGIASAPGWSSTGGYWVKPEDAMKKLEWRSITIKGGKTLKVQLPDLYCTVGPYQDYYQPNDRMDIKPYGGDLCVIAIRLPFEELTMQEMGARTDASDSIITVTFPQRHTIRALTLKSMQMGSRPRGRKPAGWNFLECSDDGKTWRPVSEIYPARIPYATVDIVPTTARFFRVRGKKLEHLTLYNVSKINHAEEQGGFALNSDYKNYKTPATLHAVNPADIIDLTGIMNADGTLRCRLPKGKWRIYRFGWSITGRVNHPASPENTGLEVDKIDSAAWTRYFHHYFDIYKEGAQGMLGKKGITHILTDSYEAGSYTWTPRLPAEFLKRRGYDLKPWLPVLTGEIIGSSDESMRFLWDWRKTLEELTAENYDRLDTIARKYGLQGRYSESHEGGRAYIADGMDVKRHATNPMAAFWMEDTPTGSSVPGAIADIRESASVAHIYGQNSVSAESFTVNGDDRHAYTYCPENMKYMADVAMSAGVTRFFIHESASQPNDDYLPGLQLYRYGQWFHRNETWANQAHTLTDYLARSSYLLSKGHAVADILLYYGEDNNITSVYGGNFEQLPQIPQGYEYDFASASVLRSEVDVANGQLTTRSGMRYKILWMDKNCETMSLDILRRISDFADAGVVICGKEPAQCAGMKADRNAFHKLVDNIWHSGKRNVTDNLATAIRLAGIEPDFKSNVPAQPYGINGMRYVHRQTDDGKEIYWVRNFSGKDQEAVMSFRHGGSYATIFDPATGHIQPVQYRKENGRVAVSLKTLSTDALFVVFSREPLAPGEPQEIFADSKHLGHEPQTIKEINTPWNIHFSQKGGGEADETFTALHSWTECENPVVKYFAGTADYTTTFILQKNDLKGSEPIYLDLGSVKNIAEIWINGESVGTEWKAPFRTRNIRPYLHKGANTLEIRVTNLWANRQIGDVQKGEKHPVTQIRRFYKPSDPLLPSGLIGPVRLIK
ncbi:Glycosyl hydrolases family 2, sugar binding domain [Prevotella sp. KH2C16]|nr:Glycosyl hydrolases family 2, sugar binding domain [Prevotella sp. KH2C16]